MTLISVVIPAYRNVATLSRTLTSLVVQRHAEWEAIVASDGSTDGTIEVARQSAAADSRIFVLDLPHGGASKARNAGLAKARGDWVLFLDADDTISPQFMAHMLKVADANPQAQIIACGFSRLDELGRLCDRIAPMPLDRDGLAICAAGPAGAIHSFLVRRTALQTVGGFDESLRTNEDWDLWLRLAHAGHKFAVTRKCLAQYWSTANSLSRETLQMVRDSRTMLEKSHALAVRPAEGLESFDMRYTPVEDLALRNWFWSAGVAIGQGRALPVLFDDISPSVDCRYQKEELALRLYNGLVVGSGTGYSGLAQRWPGLRAEVDNVLDLLSRHVGRDDVAVPIGRAVQILVARNSRPRGQIDLGHVLITRLSPGKLIRGFVAQTRADQIVFQVPLLRPVSWFSFDGALVGPLSGRDIRHIIWRSISERLEQRAATRAFFASANGARMARAAALSRRAANRLARLTSKTRIPASNGQTMHGVGRTPVAQSAGPDLEASPQDFSHPDHSSGAADWDRFFATDNPWRYDSAYEQIKYTRTLSLIQPRPDGDALEIACAEGHFTAQLAHLFKTVTAFDISVRAIERARARVGSGANVSFAQGDIFRSGIVGKFDLITCSEMLYFSPSVSSLRALAAKIAAALQPDGQFVHAHAFLIGERPNRTAFDWDGTAGGDQIFSILSATPGLVHVRSIITDLYRIDSFRKADPAVKLPASPMIEHVSLDCELPDRVAADVVWDGAVVTRAETRQCTTRTVPVLLFHGIEGIRQQTDGDAFRLTRADFERCLRKLRRHGYRSLPMTEWDQAARHSGRLRGRPLVITFDILDQALLDNCWAMVRRNGFHAHVFTTPDELMAVAGSVETIRAWMAQGMEFGSRINDIAPDTLGSSELLETALASRLALETLTGTPIHTVAPPMGMVDHRITELLRRAGYTRCFLDDGGAATLSGLDMRTPRVDMSPDNVQDILASISGHRFYEPTRISSQPKKIALS